MGAFNLETCARPNILTLEPYRCARDDYKDDDGSNIYLDANENAYPSYVTLSSPSSPPSPTTPTLQLNRYPDPHQVSVKSLLCALRTTHVHTPRSLTPANVFTGVGSDEAIDILFRVFCRPAVDAVLTCPPTYGMYSVSAQVNDVAVVRVPLLPASQDFQIDVPAVCAALSDPAANIKLAYLCSPGNPTGSPLAKDDVARILAHPTWNGVVVVDEAYVDFAAAVDDDGDKNSTSLAEWVLEWPNLVVMQTLSKAFGMANIRLGAAFAAEPVARLMNNMKGSYNVPGPTSALAERALSAEGLARMREMVARLAAQRERLVREMPRIPGVGQLRGGTATNFLLFEIVNARGASDNATALSVYKRLAEKCGVVVRFRGNDHGCEGCLRITVGTEDEVTRFLVSLREVLEEIRGVKGEEERGKEGDEEKREVEANAIVD